MSPISRILLPVDFSPQEAVAVRYAAALARSFGAALRILHVNPIWTPMLTATAPQPVLEPARITAIEAQRRRDLDTYRATDLNGIPVERLVLTGDPAERIVHQAHDGQTDLVVMATHGYGTFRQFLLGSTTAKVLHDIHCPVWTGAHMRDTAHLEWTVPKTVLCAIEELADSERLLHWAQMFASHFGAHLNVMHALPALLPPSELPDITWRAKSADQAEEKLRRLMAEAGVDGSVQITQGDAPSAVTATAVKSKAGALVIGRSPDTRAGRLRTNTYAIIRDSPCPVVSV